ncbi:uncharacterized protein LOC131176571 isoform X2 [Hevea brasiliensis]|uniref:uncharacterized protein LOC131176571 isoform X2 n=1 Tax=Hevea brasiliensis TaxID=3981 RepID=UPI0025DF0CAF|nr:uncharacterized protein LOC131176571 isoform X2 [Hevea brasiliensis]
MGKEAETSRLPSPARCCNTSFIGKGILSNCTCFERFRSSGAKKTMKEEALDSLKTMGSASIDGKKPPSPVQAFLGAISAGVISLVLYKFTTTIEAALNGQTMADNFSEIINVLCYLARFVNSVGLFLYSAQLAFNSFMEGSTREKSESEGNE